MSFSITEIDVWPRVRAAVHEKRDDQMAALVHASDWDAVVRLQTWIEALDWVLAEGRPRPVGKDEE